jgi:hypothetical protein
MRENDPNRTTLTATESSKQLRSPSAGRKFSYPGINFVPGMRLDPQLFKYKKVSYTGTRFHIQA